MIQKNGSKNTKKKIDEFIDEKLEDEDINVNEKNLFLILPEDLKNNIKRHLCSLEMPRKVSLLLLLLFWVSEIVDTKKKKDYN